MNPTGRGLVPLHVSSSCGVRSGHQPGFDLRSVCLARHEKGRRKRRRAAGDVQRVWSEAGYFWESVSALAPQTQRGSETERTARSRCTEERQRERRTDSSVIQLPLLTLDARNRFVKQGRSYTPPFVFFLWKLFNFKRIGRVRSSSTHFVEKQCH